MTRRTQNTRVFPARLPLRSRRLNAFHYENDRNPEGRTLRPRLTEEKRGPMNIRILAATLLIGVAMVLSACGGGSSGNASPPSNNWDSMLWDQGNWG